VERGAALAHGVDDRLMDGRGDLPRPLGVHAGHGGVGAHAAGVRSLIAVEDALVVLGRRHRHGPLAVAQREQGKLLALEVLLDEHARVPEPPFHEHRLERGARLVLVGRDDHALARGQPVGLEDDRIGVDRRQSLLHVAHERGGRRGYSGGLHDLLRERLGPLEARGVGRRPEGGHARLAQRVDEPRPRAAPRARRRRGRRPRRAPPPPARRRRPPRPRGAARRRPRSRRCLAPPGPRATAASASARARARARGLPLRRREPSRTRARR
jgi:hypothetical protein